MFPRAIVLAFFSFIVINTHAGSDTHEQLVAEYTKVSVPYLNSNLESWIANIKATQDLRIKLFVMHGNGAAPRAIAQSVIDKDNLLINYLQNYQGASLKQHLSQKLTDEQLKELIGFYKSQRGKVLKDASQLIKGLQLDGYSELADIATDQNSQDLPYLREVQKENLSAQEADDFTLSRYLELLTAYALTLRTTHRLKYSFPHLYTNTFGPIPGHVVVSSRKFNQWVNFAKSKEFFDIRDLDRWEPLIHEGHYIDEYYGEFAKSNNGELYKIIN